MDWEGERAERISQLQDDKEASEDEAASYISEIEELTELEDNSPEESAYLAHVTAQWRAAVYEHLEC